MKDDVRKSKSLVTSALKIREDMKRAQAKYNDEISELALLTKSELKKISSNYKEGKFNKEDITYINNLFDRLDETIIRLADTQQEMDELVSVVGGLEFSSRSTVDKLTEILLEQERQHARMTKSIAMMGEIALHLDDDENALKTLLDDVEEFFHDFSRFQDHVIESVPRVSKLFDLLDEEEEIGLRYNETL